MSRVQGARVQAFSGDRATQDAQGNASLITGLLRQAPWIDGNLLTGIALTTAGVRIEHKLGRAYRGWMLAGQSADANVWDITAEADKALFLHLDASANVTVNVVVF